MVVKMFLECHIPTERGTGKSRGFGFVTMPEAATQRVLVHDLSPQIDSHVVKVAESNTTARTNANGVAVGLGTVWVHLVIDVRLVVIEGNIVHARYQIWVDFICLEDQCL
jgi:hypothetical protein